MYRIWTDGSCAVHTTKCGGCAALVVQEGKENLISFHECNTTSQRMELAGAILALGATPVGAEMVLKTDSQYVVQGAAGNWKLKSNRDLWKVLWELEDRRFVDFIWIPRNSEREHARADKVANHKSKNCPKRLDTPG